MGEGGGSGGVGTIGDDNDIILHVFYDERNVLFCFMRESMPCSNERCIIIVL